MCKNYTKASLRYNLFFCLITKYGNNGRYDQIEIGKINVHNFVIYFPKNLLDLDTVKKKKTQKRQQHNIQV